MSVGSGLVIGHLKAKTDLSAKQYFGVIVDSVAGQVAIAGADATKFCGVLQNKPTAGQAAEVQVNGVARCIAGGTVAAGAFVTTDSAGEWVTANSADQILGLALEAAADGAVFQVLLKEGMGLVA